MASNNDPYLLRYQGVDYIIIGFLKAKQYQMEQYIKNLNFKNKKFFEEYHDTYRRTIDEFLDALNKEKPNVALKTILDSLEMIAVRTGEALNAFEGTQDEKDSHVSSFKDLVEMVVSHIAEDHLVKSIGKAHLSHLHNIIKLIFNQPTKLTTTFQLEFFRSIIKLIKSLLDKYDKELLKAIIGTLFVRFKLATVSESSENPAMRQKSRENNEICSIWRFSVEGLFDELGQKMFIENITPIQEFFEFCITNSDLKTSDSGSPGRFIANHLIYIVDHFDTLPRGSIYFDYPSDVMSCKLKTERLLKFYKELMLKENPNMETSALSHQINEIFNYSHPKNGLKIFNETNVLFFDTFFDILLQSKRAETISSLKSLHIDMSKLIKQDSPGLNALNVLIVTRMNQFAEHVCRLEFENSKNSGKKVEHNLDAFAECCDFIVRHMESKFFAGKSLLQPTITLLLSLVKMCKHTAYLKMISKLLDKDNFYVFKDYPNETVLIMSAIFDLASEVGKQIDSDFRDNNSDYFDALQSAVDKLERRLEAFSQLKVFQKCLFNKLIGVPIENNFLHQDYFKLCDISIVDLEFYPNDAADLDKLASTLAKAISPLIFDSIQPDLVLDRYDRRLRFYSTFFLKLTTSLSKRGDICVRLAEQLGKLVDTCMEKNNFKDDFDEDSFTVNYDCVHYTALFAFQNKATTISLANKLFDAWFRLFAANQDTAKICSDFYSVISLGSLNFKEQLALKAREIWTYFLDRINDTNFVNYVYQTFANSIDLFRNEFAHKYAHVLINGDEQVDFTSQYSIFIEIANRAPEFFMQRLPNKQINIIELLKKASESQLYLVVGVLYMMWQVVMKSTDLDPKYVQNVYESRHEFLIVIFNEGPNKPNKTKPRTVCSVQHYALEIRTGLVNDIYYFLVLKMDDNNAVERVKLLVLELIDLFDEMRSKDAAVFLTNIERIAKCANKKHLNAVKSHYARLSVFKKDKSLNAIVEVQNAIVSLLNFLDEKTFEKLTETVSENTGRIQVVSDKVAKTETNFNALKQDVNKQAKQVNTLTHKVNKTGKQVDELKNQVDVIDKKTLSNVPAWCRDIAKILLATKDRWVLVAKRLNFSEKDIKGWMSQAEPCMSMLQEWFVINKTSDAISGLMLVFGELNLVECIKVINENMASIEEQIVREGLQLNKDAQIDEQLMKRPPQVFICFEWSVKEQAVRLKEHLLAKLNENLSTESSRNYVDIWLDDGTMGGGNQRSSRIDVGLRSCHVLVCLVTSKSGQDQVFLNQVTLAVQLSKPIIPLLLDKALKWPPSGSLGPILSEYLFIRFFQRANEETKDQRYWPVDKFNELVMQLKHLIPSNGSAAGDSSIKIDPAAQPDVFISYQWGVQRDIIALYNKLSGMGLTVWLDVHQMGGGDSLYDKIDNGIRNCKVVVSCITTKYGLSANCRKEVALADSLSKPIVPILLEKNLAYPLKGPMGPTLSTLAYIDFTGNFNESDNSIKWEGKPFFKLLESMKTHLTEEIVEKMASKACLIS